MFDAILPVLGYPEIGPEIFRIGPFALRWYSLAYVAGILLGWWWMARFTKIHSPPFTRRDVDDFVLWVAAGIILGGRIGYVLFYNPGYYLAHPSEILMVWGGGMSFHGGLLGVILAILWFTRKRGLNVFSFSDYIACVVPFGLFFGRIANFINGELWGRASDVPWAMVFPDAGSEPRHPSQLYEAALEGAVLFAVLNYFMLRTNARAFPGMINGMFFVLYGVFRYAIEFVRVPDEQLGQLWGVITMGQLLSLPMIAFGLWLIATSRRRATPLAKA
ncbi:MAG TPA: prolipoprotein diacylglyceryl transferase [Sphingomonadales bacterium]|nr:prolipoprotein diacylglyceryl transferase [Sphingomonadales bacterium]